MSVSDSGGIGSDFGRVQNAQMILAASQGDVNSGANILAIPIAWLSCRCRRVVNSTLAGETQAALSAAVEVEWAQIMIRDVLKGDVVDL